MCTTKTRWKKENLVDVAEVFGSVAADRKNGCGAMEDVNIRLFFIRTGLVQVATIIQLSLHNFGKTAVRTLRMNHFTIGSWYCKGAALL